MEEQGSSQTNELPLNDAEETEWRKLACQEEAKPFAILLSERLELLRKQKMQGEITDINDLTIAALALRELTASFYEIYQAPLQHNLKGKKPLIFQRTLIHLRSSAALIKIRTSLQRILSESDPIREETGNWNMLSLFPRIIDETTAPCEAAIAKQVSEQEAHCLSKDDLFRITHHIIVDILTLTAQLKEQQSVEDLESILSKIICLIIESTPTLNHKDKKLRGLCEEVLREYCLVYLMDIARLRKKHSPLEKLATHTDLPKNIFANEEPPNGALSDYGVCARLISTGHALALMTSIHYYKETTWENVAKLLQEVENIQMKKTEQEQNPSKPWYKRWFGL